LLNGGVLILNRGFSLNCNSTNDCYEIGIRETVAIKLYAPKYEIAVSRV